LVDYKHVKGHQDNEANNTLDFYAQLNIKADKLAKQGSLMITNNNKEVVIDDKVWGLYINGEKISKNIDTQIHEKVNTPTIQSYWHKKGKIQEEYFDQVSWESMGRVIKNQQFKLNTGSPNEQQVTVVPTQFYY
jgi:hypothetical protein